MMAALMVKIHISAHVIASINVNKNELKKNIYNKIKLRLILINTKLNLIEKYYDS